jgi:transcriptional regulator with XRE-family HTH domain
MEQIYREFGRILKKRRKEAKLTQDDIANKVGLVRTSITNIEQGKQHVSLHMLFQLADAIGARPQDLLPERIVQPLSAELEKTLGSVQLEEEGKDWIRRIMSNTHT